MNIVISVLIGLFFGLFCGGLIGAAIAAILAAGGCYDDQQDAHAENILLRRENARLHDQIATLTVTLSATRDREEILAELSREMNQ